MPYFGLHVAVISVFWVGFSWVALGVMLFTLFARVFALTAFYHRYFSHKSFKTTRWFQFVAAFWGSTAAQRGPIWWSAHHRRHHQVSDLPPDVHSPVQHGFWWSHMLWFLSDENFKTNPKLVKDWMKYPELRFIDRHDYLAPATLALAMFGLGAGLNALWPSLGTNGLQMMIWGFLISTIFVYHITYCVNSLAHTIGSRRYKTHDDSRNNWLIALLTFGEGWHNNHHRYPASVRQGFYWWELDMSYCILWCMSKVGLVWELKPVPQHILEEGREHKG
ncbi:MAG: acyl-CoA desaturase [Planctomycetota bacterium]